jgi:hypothetical protein
MFEDHSRAFASDNLGQKRENPMNTNLRDLSQHWASAELTGDADFIDGLLLGGNGS